LYLIFLFLNFFFLVKSDDKKDNFKFSYWSSLIDSYQKDNEKIKVNYQNLLIKLKENFLYVRETSDVEYFQDLLDKYKNEILQKLKLKDEKLKLIIDKFVEFYFCLDEVDLQIQNYENNQSQCIKSTQFILNFFILKCEKLFKYLKSQEKEILSSTISLKKMISELEELSNEAYNSKEIWEFWLNQEIIINDLFLELENLEKKLAKKNKTNEEKENFSFFLKIKENFLAELEENARNKLTINLKFNRLSKFNVEKFFKKISLLKLRINWILKNFY
jgi:hypothetical protein